MNLAFDLGLKWQNLGCMSLIDSRKATNPSSPLLDSIFHLESSRSNMASLCCAEIQPHGAPRSQTDHSFKFRRFLQWFGGFNWGNELADVGLQQNQVAFVVVLRAEEASRLISTPYWCCQCSPNLIQVTCPLARNRHCSEPTLLRVSNAQHGQQSPIPRDPRGKLRSTHSTRRALPIRIVLSELCVPGAPAILQVGHLHAQPAAELASSARLSEASRSKQSLLDVRWL